MKQEELLKRLIEDTCSTLPEKERTLEKCSVEALVWNLVHGKYQYSLRDLKYIISCKNGN